LSTRFRESIKTALAMTIAYGIALAMTIAYGIALATLDTVAKEQISDREGEHLYRLLGAYRGVSEAMVDSVGSAGDVDWDRWREPHF